MPRAKKQQKKVEPIRVDIGCGKNKKEGFIGVDRLKFDGVDIVMDAGKDRWPWADGAVEELHCSHFLEHLKPAERIHAVNEAYRVLKPNGRMTFITPHWCAARAYGDLTHEWPPVSEFWLGYLNKSWREVNAPHNTDYTCDFDSTFGYSLGPASIGRSQDFVNFGMQNYKEFAQDMIATLIKTERTTAT